jgi:dTDP-4-dehydrorhamnose reductase
MRPDVLVLGAGGQVGWELRRALAPLGRLATLDYPEVDFADMDGLRQAVKRAAPAVIVNAAAHTAVDKAESEEGLAFKINAEAVALLAEEAKASGALLVHYSTDYVFDGTKADPYVETDKTCPMGVYGRSKAAGEEAVAASGCDALVFRTSWVFGMHGGNFVKTILRLAGERDTLRVVDDQVGSPTPAALIADITAHALRAVGAGTMTPGLYHLAAAEPVSWHAFACAIVDTARRQGRSLRLTAENIAAIPSSEYPVPARRPANSRLSCDRLESALDITLPSWRSYLERQLEFS